MRIVLQRVASASVRVDGETVGEIAAGILLFVGFAAGDTVQRFEQAIEKVLTLRVFPEDGKPFDRSTEDLQRDVLLVSQFTLSADCRKGRRPDFALAMKADEARGLWDSFVARFRTRYSGRVECGRFQAHMDVQLVNDGPVTLLLDF